MWTITKKYKNQDEHQVIYRDYSEAKVRRQFLKYKANLHLTESLHLIHGGDILENITGDKSINAVMATIC